MKYINEIIAFLSGGSILAVANFFRSQRKDKVDEFVTLIEKWKEVNKDQDEKFREHETLYDDAKRAIVKLTEEINKLKTKILLLESTHIDFPFPAWFKDNSLKMMALNQSYEDVFLKPRGLTMMDYIGKTDFDIYEDHIATKYVENDKRVLKHHSDVWMGDEPLFVNNEDVSHRFRVVKFKRYSGNTVIGIGGFAIPINKD